MGKIVMVCGKEHKLTMESIVDYIERKELKEMHKELHPRENPK